MACHNLSHWIILPRISYCVTVPDQLLRDGTRCSCVSLAGKMSLLGFFKAVNQLPTARDTGLLEHVVNEVNRAVEE